MSVEKQRQIAERWLRTAEDDLDAAQILQASSKHAHSCFLAQQAGEKAIKALSHACDFDPWGHSIRKLVSDLVDRRPDLSPDLLTISREALELDRYYIPTRYPDGLPDLTPAQAFEHVDSEQGIIHAEKILNLVRKLLSPIAP